MLPRGPFGNGQSRQRAARLRKATDALSAGRYVVDAQRVVEGFLRNEAQWRHAARLS